MFEKNFTLENVKVPKIQNTVLLKRSNWQLLGRQNDQI